jgi:hypothetical protein
VENWLRRWSRMISMDAASKAVKLPCAVNVEG